MKVFNAFKKPRRLKRGDTIGIVAPAWTFDRSNFIKGLKKLSDLGFKIKYDPSIFHEYWSMAGHDRERAEQINRMFADRQVKAIFCAKAGYGSLRTLPYLDKKIIKKNPKIFVGYSDITILLSYLQKIGRMVVFHGPVVSGEICEGMNPITFKHLLRAIMKPYKLGQMKFSSLKSLRPGKANGILVGGNMSLIVSSIGTSYEINTDNKILFLEDVGEDLETIDNYLMHLKLAKKFQKVKGIIFGRMIGCVDHSGKKYTIKHILNDILGDLDIPIIYGFPSGHRIFKDINITLPFGVSVTLDGYKTKLIINRAAVK
ncbi:MAG: LD-carboxypeptidase [Candidatus Omnitrophica bacterium]|nr:LD-carboxypeptidase [Candidatus Omnitrophota bacterium]